MISDIMKSAESRMQKSIESLKNELTKIRTGRAHPSLLDHISVDYYGSMMALSQVANIAIEDARTLSITPWEKPMVAVIEKAILKSDLGLNPAVAGTVIRVPVPALTEERRRDLVKVVKNEAEGARVAIRNIRRDANGELKALEKDKTISEDEERRAEDNVQKLTDKYIKEVEAVFEKKEKDLMAI
ncbi:ribosome recycling factor [Thiothrix eikelboomii]|uniref:Ribosome-recycling factor n=1 Tax=Thiothrix eikelboomii TaxID=92487 RepID=A0A1T4WX93_9GAMM|nr:ribosome recycling factor [Thiothrix eikelboomii]SKA81924.1 ribosome recycling factor [Thiothrix eikelboomii]